MLLKNFVGDLPVNADARYDSVAAAAQQKSKRSVYRRVGPSSAATPSGLTVTETAPVALGSLVTSIAGSPVAYDAWDQTTNTFNSALNLRFRRGAPRRRQGGTNRKQICNAIPLQATNAYSFDLIYHGQIIEFGFSYSDPGGSILNTVGYGGKYRILIDGVPISGSAYAIVPSNGAAGAPPTNAQAFTIKLDFGSAAERLITFECTKLHLQNVWTEAYANTGAGLIRKPDADYPLGPRCIMVIDSIGDDGGNYTRGQALTTLPRWFGEAMGWDVWVDGQGGTGYYNRNNNNRQKANFQERAAPSVNSFYFEISAGSGNFTISVTTGGSTQTTANIAAAATADNIRDAIELLSNVNGSGGTKVRIFLNGGSSTQAEYCVIQFIDTLLTATLSMSVTNVSLTGNMASTFPAGGVTVSRWQGTVVPYAPQYVVWAGGFNDDTTVTGSGTMVQTEANMRACFEYVYAAFPTCQQIVFGPWIPLVSPSPTLLAVQTLLAALVVEYAAKGYPIVYSTDTGFVTAASITALVSADAVHPANDYACAAHGRHHANQVRPLLTI